MQRLPAARPTTLLRPPGALPRRVAAPVTGPPEPTPMPALPVTAAVAALMRGHHGGTRQTASVAAPALRAPVHLRRHGL